MNNKLLHIEQQLRATVFAACFHSDAPSCSELADVPHPVDCIMVYIYCTNTLSGSLLLSHKANMHLHGDGWRKKNENTPNPKEEMHVMAQANTHIDWETLPLAGINNIQFNSN